MTSLDKRIAIRPNVLVRELRGESVLLNLDSEAYFGLDEIGTGMWRALTSTATVREACDALLSEYDVEPQRLEQDLGLFVEKLAGAGLIDVRDA
jgi:Coenzyme PQQ synthesis protein D (PqqD)